MQDEQIPTETVSNKVETEDDKNGKLLTNIYYTPGHPGSFSSEKRLYDEAKKENPQISRKFVKEFMNKQYVVSRHKRLRKTFPRRKVLILRINQSWSVDLVQCDLLKNYNRGYGYIVNCIDLFSKKLWARPIRQKTKKEVEAALESIIEENDMVSPYKLWTDNGKFRSILFHSPLPHILLYIPSLFPIRNRIYVAERILREA